MEQRIVIVNSTEIKYNLIRKSVKNINLRIKPDGQIYVSASKSVKIAHIDKFIIEKSHWILTHLKPKKPPLDIVPIRYIEGEKLLYLGDVLTLSVIAGVKESVQITDKLLVITAKDTSDFNRKSNLVLRWKTQQCEIIFQKISREVFKLFSQYELLYPIIKLREMTSRWGSCHTTRGIITLNKRLIEKPISCIEYVILHEYSHFIHPNHSRLFYDFVENLMPDYRIRKNILEGKI